MTVTRTATKNVASLAPGISYAARIYEYPAGLFQLSVSVSPIRSEHDCIVKEQFSTLSEAKIRADEIVIKWEEERLAGRPGGTATPAQFSAMVVGTKWDDEHLQLNIACGISGRKYRSTISRRPDGKYAVMVVSYIGGRLPNEPATSPVSRVLEDEESAKAHAKQGIADLWNQCNPLIRPEIREEFRKRLDAAQWE